MNICNQSKAEKEWLEGMGWSGYDRISNNRSFGLIKDKEQQAFKHIPDAVAINRRTLDLYIMDHKTCELNGTQCKRTADANQQNNLLRGNKGFSVMSSWSNSFHQKDSIQRAFRTMTAGNVFYVVVTRDLIEMKKSWRKKNPFVVNITEGETFKMRDHMVEIESFDERMDSTVMKGYGALLIDLPVVVDSGETFKAITPEGVKIYPATNLNRPDNVSVKSKLLI